MKRQSDDDAEHAARVAAARSAETPPEARRRLADEPLPESYRRFLDD